jgi:hypothetical protein
MRQLRLIRFLKIIGAFFPVHIIFAQLKYNLISMFYWAFLFMLISGSFGKAFGVPYLFLSPEYLGDVSAWSFVLLGFSIGGFIMAFNTYSYIKLGPRYSFLAIVSRPFYKFCINNSFIPVLFIFYYIYKMTQFQRIEELSSFWDLFIYTFSFLGGIFAFILLSLFYFFPTTREKGKKISQEDSSTNPIQSVTQSSTKWYNYFRTENEKTHHYIGKGLKIYQSRSTKHLDKTIIENVFAKNRINASIFEILTIVTFIISGQFIDYPLFEFPAGMSIILLLTMIHMLFSALMSWFHRWTYPIIFASIALMNYLSVTTELFTFKNFAYGLDYSDSKIQDYSINAIELNYKKNDSDVESKKNIISILENWKKKTGEKKPKLIVLNTSGGGSRSALWTFTVLQNCDQALNQQLTEHLNLITGASGGMVGAAYYREICLRNNKKEIANRYAKKYGDNLSKDLLNKLAFSISTNDLFFRYRSFSYNNIKYTRDRGYAFEEHLHENTENLLQHNLGYYKNYEQQAEIPLMIFSPTIVNDGRRLLMSSQSLSFLTKNKDYPTHVKSSFENIDYQSFFSENNPQEMRFSSVLRASATFPFIIPMMTMPTEPGMQLMDAGIRDNYGTKTTMDYLFSIEKWIKENTSGVIILEIRDTRRILSNEIYEHISLTHKITLPFGNMYKNFPRTQDFDQEQLFNLGIKSFLFPIDIISFNLRESKNDHISLSWHLTKQEKNKIAKAFYSVNNQTSLERLKALIAHKKTI